MGVINPSQFSVGDAWSEYQRLTMEALSNQALFADLSHSAARARAWERWRNLFLAGERK